VISLTILFTIDKNTILYTYNNILKIVYITNARLPTEKAHGVQIIKMIEALSSLNNEVVLISPNRIQNEISHKTSVFDFYNVEKIFEHNLINFIDPYKYRSLMPKFFYRFFSFLVNLLWGIKSAKIGSKLNGDFYIFRDNTPFSYLFCAIFSKKCVIEFHDIPPFLSRLIFKLGLMISGKTVCFAVTNKLSEDLFHKFGKVKNLKKIDTLHDGVDLIKFKNNKIIENSTPLLTYCGSLSKSKGIDLIINSAKYINNVEFLIIGGLKVEVDHYKKIANDNGVKNINFIGQVNYSDVPNLLNKSDILLLPSSAKNIKSRNYTSAMKLFEYMSIGKPIIASNIPSNTEILENNLNCLLFEPDNPKSMVEKINTLINDKELNKKITKNSSKLAIKYSWTERSKKMIKRIKID
tara:strand:- start:1235 stop:2458 length:1224 start_codon:yes stop_codon:yes gene_type:complete